MKSIKNTFYALIASFVLLASCKSNPKDLIANKWQVTDVKVEGTEVTESDLAVMKTVVMEFTKDGKLTVNGTGVNESGTYTVSEDGKTFTSTNSTGKTTTNEIQKLTSDDLVVRDPQSKVTITMKKK
jgi:hypothetical protein